MKKYLISSKLFITCNGMINLSSLRFDNSIQFLNTCPIRIGLKLVFLILGSKISENLLFSRSKRILIVSFSISRLDFRFWHEPRSCTGLPVLEWAKKGLSWQQTFCKRVISLSSVRWFFSLLKNQWWRERFPDGLIVEFRVTQVRGHRVFVAGLLLDDHCRSLWVVEVVEELGLITCGRSVFHQRARLLSWRRHKDKLHWRCPHGRRSSGQSTGRSGKRRTRWKRDTRRESERSNNEEQALNRSSWMAWMWCDARMRTLEPCPCLVIFWSIVGQCLDHVWSFWVIVWSIFVSGGSGSMLLVSDTRPRGLCMRDAFHKRTCIKKTKTSWQASWYTLGILNPKRERNRVVRGGKYR